MGHDDEIFSSQQVLAEYDSECTFIPVNSKSAKNKAGEESANSEEVSLHRHWARRYDYFSKYDEGTLFDRTGWYSVTPETIAQTIATLIPSNSIVFDGFVGLGGNAIQFAHENIVIGTDIDQHRLQLCRHNARIYGVESNIELIRCDFLQAAKCIRADIVFLSPPWGGPSCNNRTVYRLEDMPISGSEVFEAAKLVSPNIVFYLPRHTSITDLAGLEPDGHFRVVLHREGRRRIVAMSVLYGEMFVYDDEEEPEHDVYE